MLIHYFSVRNCTYEIYEGKPAIFAPEEADINSPTISFNFFQTIDGRWCHYLSEEEYYYIMSFPKDTDVTFGKAPKPTDDLSAKEKRYANILCLISIGFIICGILISFFGRGMIALHCWVTALILMITVRVRYPGSLFGKILMMICIILAVSAVGMLIFAMITSFANSFLDSLLTCPVPK